MTTTYEEMPLVCDKREFRTWFKSQYPVFATTYKDTPEGATFRIQLTEFSLAYRRENGHYKYIFTVCDDIKGHSKIRDEFIGTVRNTFVDPAAQVDTAKPESESQKGKKTNLRTLERARIYNHLSPFIKSLRVRPTAKECIAKIKEYPAYKNKKISRQRMESILSEGASGKYDDIKNIR